MSGIHAATFLPDKMMQEFEPWAAVHLREISEALGSHGLIIRGGLDFDEHETVPDGPDGRTARSVVLVGHAGATHWPHFNKWRESQPGGIENPLDTWSRAVIDEIAARFRSRAVSPSDKPFLPFQQWAMRAERLEPSPLGILMHPRFGLWHAYRGALLFDRPLGFAEIEKPIHVCDACIGKPCMNACPVEAHSGSRFDYPACLSHVADKSGGECRGDGCRDRNACIYAETYRYPADMQAFHMSAFMR